MREAGYAYNYARTAAHKVLARRSTQELIQAKKEDIEARQLWDLEKVEREFLVQYKKADDNNDRSNCARILENLTKMKGGFTAEKPNPEDIQRLSAEEQRRLQEITRLLTRHLSEGKSADDIIAGLRRLDALKIADKRA